MQEQPLIVVGASARAAACSALRAGLRPWCLDLFADADLKARCPVIRIEPESYPHGLANLLREAPQAPWLYTGGLENYPELVDQMAEIRPLWGNRGDVLRAARDPFRLFHAFRDAGLPCPEVRRKPPTLSIEGYTSNAPLTRGPHPPLPFPSRGGKGGVRPASCIKSETVNKKRWLEKPFAGAGGQGVRFWTSSNERKNRRCYFQEFMSGENAAAVFCGIPGQAKLLGVTRQLVGETWLNAKPFHYCGSIGPLTLNGALQQRVDQIGRVLVEQSGLRGLFGVDLVIRDDMPYPVEVNPRYTASMEVLEYATGLRVMDWHRRAFDSSEEFHTPDTRKDGTSSRVVGKAILFAARSFEFPRHEAWKNLVCIDKSSSGSPPPYPPRNGGGRGGLTRSNPLRISDQIGGLSRSTMVGTDSHFEIPAFADIPEPGMIIQADWPILTCFAEGDSIEQVADRLRTITSSVCK